MTSRPQMYGACAGFGAVFLALGLSGAAVAGDGHDWKYGPSGDDSAWGGLCEIGVEQSPIDIPSWNGLGTGQVRPIAFDYGKTGGVVSNNGHSIVVTPPKGNTLTIGGETFSLAQFHFHTPSEHLNNGHRYPMEMHLVHVDASGAPKLVVGIFVDDDWEQSATRNNMSDPTASMVLAGLPLPAHKGDEIALPGVIDLLDLMPVDISGRRGEHVEFAGSLTTPTPTCLEGLTWIVMGYSLHTTPEVIAKFHAIMGDNYREAQALGNRAIRCCGGGDSESF